MNTELLFQTNHSAKQLSVHGAVANWCHQLGLTISSDNSNWKQDARLTQLCEKSLLPISCGSREAVQNFDQMETTDGEQSLLCVENIRVLDLTRKPKFWRPRGGRLALGPWNFDRSFSLRSRHPDFIFPLNCRVKWRGGESSKSEWKTTNFEHPFDQKVPSGVDYYHKSADFSISHTDAHDRLDDISIHHKPHFPQITSVFKPSHNKVRSTEERFDIWSAWRPEATVPRRSRPRWACPNRQRIGRRLFLNGDPEIWNRAARRHGAKTPHSTHHLTPCHSPQTPTAPQRQTTRGKTMPICDASRTKIFEHPQTQNGARSHKNLENEPLGSFFWRPCRRWWKTQCKNEESPKFRKMCIVHFSPHTKHTFVKRCLKQHALLAHPPTERFTRFSAHSNFDVFRHQKGGSNQEDRSKSGSCIEFSTSQTSQRAAIPIEKVRPKGEAFLVLRDERGPGLSGHPVFPKAQSLDQFWKFILRKFLTDMEYKLRFHQLLIVWTRLTLLNSQKQSVLWMRFMITKKSSANCSQTFRDQKEANLMEKKKQKHQGILCEPSKRPSTPK